MTFKEFVDKYELEVYSNFKGKRTDILGWEYNEYRCTIYSAAMREPFIITYKMGLGLKCYPIISEVLCSVTMDSHAYLNTNSISDFQQEFGYETISQAKKIRLACKDIYMKLLISFTKDQVAELVECEED